jgi:hypothetical protein
MWGDLVVLSFVFPFLFLAVLAMGAHPFMF